LEHGVVANSGVAEGPGIALEHYGAEIIRSVFTHTDHQGEPVLKGKRGGDYEPDPDLRDFENVPLEEDVEVYFHREVLRHLHDAWIDHRKDKVGYEINFNRHFYSYNPPRPLEEIDSDLKEAEQEITELLREVTE
jgi:type I restriction enzyme M protein